MDCITLASLQCQVSAAALGDYQGRIGSVVRSAGGHCQVCNVGCSRQLRLWLLDRDFAAVKAACAMDQAGHGIETSYRWGAYCKHFKQVLEALATASVPAKRSS